MGSNKGNAMRSVIRAVIRATRCGRRDVGQRDGDDAMGTTRSGSTTTTSLTPSN